VASESWVALAIVNPAVTDHGEGEMAELRRALKASSTIGQLTITWRWVAAWRREGGGARLARGETLLSSLRETLMT
jgi:hypothetical protein